jgi:hypothetical protein
MGHKDDFETWKNTKHLIKLRDAYFLIRGY